MRIPAVEVRSAIAVSRWAAKTVSIAGAAARSANGISDVSLTDFIPFRPGLSIFHCQNLNPPYDASATPHVALRPSTSLTGRTRPALVLVFDRGMRVARAPKRVDAIKAVLALRRQFIENEHIIPQPEPFELARGPARRDEMVVVGFLPKPPRPGQTFSVQLCFRPGLVQPQCPLRPRRGRSPISLPRRRPSRRTRLLRGRIRGPKRRPV
jgi:hypothetical protein